MKGFGLISILITVAVICLLVYGAFYLDRGGNPVNQLQQGQSAVDSAKDAANQGNNYNSSIQEEINGNVNVDYRAAQQKALRDLQK